MLATVRASRLESLGSFRGFGRTNEKEVYHRLALQGLSSRWLGYPIRLIRAPTTI